jgi:hypothetical protein
MVLDFIVLAFLVYSSGFVNYFLMADEYIRTAVENGIYDIS